MSPEQMQSMMSSMAGMSPAMMQQAMAQVQSMSPAELAAAQRQMAGMDPATLSRQAAEASKIMSAREQYAVSASNQLKAEGNKLHAAGERQQQSQQLMCAAAARTLQLRARHTPVAVMCTLAAVYTLRCVSTHAPVDGRLLPLKSPCPSLHLQANTRMPRRSMSERVPTWMA